MKRHEEWSCASCGARWPVQSKPEKCPACSAPCVYPESPPAPPASRDFPRAHWAKQATTGIERLDDALDQVRFAVEALLELPHEAPPARYFAVPEDVAGVVRDALAGAVGWLDTLNPTESRRRRLSELREALNALSRHCNPGAPRFPPPASNE